MLRVSEIELEGNYLMDDDQFNEIVRNATAASIECHHIGEAEQYLSDRLREAGLRDLVVIGSGTAHVWVKEIREDGEVGTDRLLMIVSA
jgi:uncharacterized protein with HEPN domain